MSSILTPNERTFGKSGIEVHQTFGVVDASKLKKLMSCPRDFFYTHVLGWQMEGFNINFAFGSAWHSGQEVIQSKGSTAEVVQEAYEAFILKLQQDTGLPLENLTQIHVSKNPETALKGLAEYAAIWKDDPKETMYVEIAGTAPISDDRIFHVKLDTIKRRKNTGKIFSLEHKTTTRFSDSWQEKWQYDFQVGAYDHFLKCLFEPSEVEGVVINGAVFNKNKRQFPRFPIIITPEMWEMWIYEANHWWNYLEMNMRHLYETSPSDRVMVAFPRNSESCSKFGCNHPQLCTMKANPLQRMDTPPFGYCKKFWDPREREKGAVQKGSNVSIAIKKDLTAI
ncbi:MAG: PD-(D/E)XK nuclease family protein [Planctomycetes bacterium]|nr:PD-(D/E)XK nuclease family protein [Planctomycetota bacterium]